MNILLELTGNAAAEYFKKLYTAVHNLKKYVTPNAELELVDSTTLVIRSVSLNSAYMIDFKKIPDTSPLFDIDVSCTIVLDKFLEQYDYHKLNCTSVVFTSDGITISGIPKKLSKISDTNTAEDVASNTKSTKFTVTSNKRLTSLLDKLDSVENEMTDPSSSKFSTGIIPDNKLFSVFLDNPEANTLALAVMPKALILADAVPDSAVDDVVRHILLSEKQLIKGKATSKHRINIIDNLFELITIESGLLEYSQIFRIVKI